MKVANILLNGVRYESDLSENVETGESQMSMKLLCIAIYRMPPSLRSLCTNHFLGERNLRKICVLLCFCVDLCGLRCSFLLACPQAGCLLKACCSSTLTSWGRLCLKETPKHPMTPRLTNATMLVLAWAAGACASMHSVLLSTQVGTHNSTA